MKEHDSELDTRLADSFEGFLFLQVSHIVNELSFGAHFPGRVNPLDK